LYRQALENQKALTFVGDLANGPQTVDGQPFPRQHQGHGGYTIDSGQGHNGISGEITNSALADYEPHIVLLKIGTNDINGNIDLANAPTRLGNLIDDITSAAPDTLLVVSTIVPTRTDGTNQRVEAYNNALKDEVSTREMAGAHIVLLDSYTVFTANGDYKNAWLGDNLHPNDAGYEVLGQSFYDTIEAFLPAAQ
jgi:lysophospholipase L1-like esterase